MRLPFRHTAPVLLAALLAAASAQAGEVRGFERLDRPQTPGERAGAAALGSYGGGYGAGLPTAVDPVTGMAAGPRQTDGNVTMQVYGAWGVAGDGPQQRRTATLLGERDLSDWSSFDRSSSRYSYSQPFAGYAPAWRDFSFARRLTRDEGFGLPSVSAPRDFYGFGR